MRTSIEDGDQLLHSWRVGILGRHAEAALAAGLGSGRIGAGDKRAVRGHFDLPGDCREVLGRREAEVNLSRGATRCEGERTLGRTALGSEVFQSSGELARAGDKDLHQAFGLGAVAGFKQRFVMT